MTSGFGYRILKIRKSGTNVKMVRCLYFSPSMHQEPLSLIKYMPIKGKYSISDPRSPSG
jgi:hypothetical protein